MRYLLVFLLLLLGCSAEKPAAVPTATPIINPQEVQQIQRGLYSDNIRLQYPALQAVAKIPGLEKPHQERIRVLAQSSNPQVKEAATKLISPGQ